MRVLMCNTYGNLGGASKAAVRLMQGVAELGLDASMMSLQGGGENIRLPTGRVDIFRAKLSRYLERKTENLFKVQNDVGMFSIPSVSSGLRKEIDSYGPDIVHLHWVNSGLLNIADIGMLNNPAVWTLHDMWPFTGGCHYSGACSMYTSGCKQCSMIKIPKLAESQIEKKLKHWDNSEIVVVTPSRWMANCAESSLVFKNIKIQVIPNGIDTEIYKPVSKTIARKLLGLEPDKKYILFGAISALDDRRKGYQYLEASLENAISEYSSDIEVVVFGVSKPEKPLNVSVPVHYIGHLYDEVSLVVAYNAADVMLVPSEQDNLPNTIVEALSCGVPCVAFDIGGIPDLISHKKTGFLAKPFNTDDFTAGILWVLNEEQEKLSSACREKAVTDYCLNKVSAQYLSLYQELLN